MLPSITRGGGWGQVCAGLLWAWLVVAGSGAEHARRPSSMSRLHHHHADVFPLLSMLHSLTVAGFVSVAVPGEIPGSSICPPLVGRLVGWLVRLCTHAAVVCFFPWLAHSLVSSFVRSFAR